jgi:hypothetical protein
MIWILPFAISKDSTKVSSSEIQIEALQLSFQQSIGKGKGLIRCKGS